MFAGKTDETEKIENISHFKSFENCFLLAGMEVLTESFSGGAEKKTHRGEMESRRLQVRL